ncbi:Protein of unknown function [Catalinimonas alkaloidigena]|uniref:DUF4199 domain-containing protein n=1 Tax=Catalinimonas alkaloidigena TaxID=1075417 RepID=A0A1G9USL2_9BACT|nr:DUF4199 domain-containing protein [Catalinimonas alkaloidigena]SDM62797.1 Protein of unknown function [Catalinimonas alkaloidigena]
MKHTWPTYAVLMGLAGGVACIVYYLLLPLFCINPFWTAREGRVIIILAMLVGGMILFRRNQPDGRMHLWEGLFMGGISWSLLTALSAMGLYLIAQYIAPDLLENYIQLSLERLESMREQHVEKLGVESFEAMQQGIRALRAGGVVRDEVVKNAIYGFFLIPLISMIFRKQ